MRRIWLPNRAGWVFIVAMLLVPTLIRLMEHA